MDKEVHNRPKRGRAFIVFVSSAIILYLTFTAGFYMAKRGLNPKIIPGYLINTDVNKPQNVDFSLFWDVWNKAHNEYVGNLDDQKMVYGAINGALSALGDPYTIFLDPELNKKFQEEISGEFEGIGAELSQRSGHLIIVSPIDGSPAAKAGLLAGDIIDAIDGKKTTDMTVDQAVDLIRGAKGTKVTLSIIRNGNAKDYTLTRDTINIKSVTSEFKEYNGKRVAIAKISQFGDDTTELMSSFASDAVKNKSQGIILDLRNNPGGYLDSAIDVASLFVKDGVIVKEKDKNGEIKDYTATQNAKLAGLPIVVLINGGSASASEIVAGALLDHKIATLIGEKSFGKGSVQTIDELSGGGAFKVTIAKWLTPNGTEIDGVGIKPSIEIGRSEDDINNDRDPQMSAALNEVSK
jgi:carboxyl-terminal processing protease